MQFLIDKHTHPTNKKQNEEYHESQAFFVLLFYIKN